MKKDMWNLVCVIHQTASLNSVGVLARKTYGANGEVADARLPTAEKYF